MDPTRELYPVLVQSPRYIAHFNTLELSWVCVDEERCRAIAMPGSGTQAEIEAECFKRNLAWQQELIARGLLPASAASSAAAE